MVIIGYKHGNRCAFDSSICYTCEEFRLQSYRSILDVSIICFYYLRLHHRHLLMANKLQMALAMVTQAVVKSTAAAITSHRARTNTATKAVTTRALRVVTQVAAAASKLIPSAKCFLQFFILFYISFKGIGILPAVAALIVTKIRRAAAVVAALTNLRRHLETRIRIDIAIRTSIPLVVPVETKIRIVAIKKRTAAIKTRNVSTKTRFAAIKTRNVAAIKTRVATRIGIVNVTRISPGIRIKIKSAAKITRAGWLKTKFMLQFPRLNRYILNSSDKDKSVSSRDKDKHESRTGGDKDKDRHKSSSSSSKHGHSSSSSKHKHSSSSRDKDRSSGSRKDKVKEPPAAPRNQIEDDDEDEVKIEVEEDPFAGIQNVPPSIPFDVSQASSCDYSMSQFKPDESQFVIKAEQSDEEMNGNGNGDANDDEQSQDCQYAKIKQETPVKIEAADDEDDEDDMPIVRYATSPKISLFSVFVIALQAKRSKIIKKEENSDDDDDIPLTARKKVKTEKIKKAKKKKHQESDQEEEEEYDDRPKKKKIKKEKVCNVANREILIILICFY